MAMKAFISVFTDFNATVGLVVLASLGYVGYQYAKPTIATPSLSQENTETSLLANFLRTTQTIEVPQKKITYIQPTIENEKIYKKNLDDILEKVSKVHQKIEAEKKRIEQQRPKYGRPPTELLKDLNVAREESQELYDQLWTNIHSLYGYLKEQDPNLYKEKSDQEYKRYLDAIR
jgi:hypothetical protein